MAFPFFSLPLELREMVYESVFQSETISHGLGKPPSHRTALLQTCQRIYNEARLFLVSNARFHFRSTEVMLDTLSNLDNSTISGICEIRVKAFPFPLHTRTERIYMGLPKYYTTYHFANALSLFPGLKLDRLIVEDCYHDSDLIDGFGDLGTYQEICMLLETDGWQELHFITPSTEFMTSTRDTYSRNVAQREAQPGDWDCRLQKRDGTDSGATVNLYIAHEAKLRGATGNAASCRSWSAETSTSSIPPIVSDEELYKEVRVVARRGKHVDYTQKANKEDKDILQLFGRHQWQAIKDKSYVPSWNEHCYNYSERIGWLYGAFFRRQQLAARALEA